MWMQVICLTINKIPSASLRVSGLQNTWKKAFEFWQRARWKSKNQKGHMRSQTARELRECLAARYQRTACWGNECDYYEYCEPKGESYENYFFFKQFMKNLKSHPAFAVLPIRKWETWHYTTDSTLSQTMSVFPMLATFELNIRTLVEANLLNCPWFMILQILIIHVVVV